MLGPMRSDRPRLLLRDTACLLALALLVATAAAVTAGVQGAGPDIRRVALVDAGHRGLRTETLIAIERPAPCAACGHLGLLPAAPKADAAPASWRLLDMPPPAR